MPKEAEDYVHRVGRTGRASARGMASTFAAPNEANDLRKIERKLAIKPRIFRVRTKTAAHAAAL
jgi:ATP-dependent RNA helicase RhlE